MILITYRNSPTASVRVALERNVKKGKASKRSLKKGGEASRIKKILGKIPGMAKHVKVRGELIFMDIGVIRSGDQGLEVSFASDANTTLVAAVTRELATRYAIKITPPHYEAIDGTCHLGQESERAYRKDLEDYFKKKLAHEAMAEIMFREYESDTVH